MSMERVSVGWAWRKLGRLWRRLLERDFIRRRPKNICPREGLNIGAYAIAYNDYGGYCVPLESIHRPASRHIMGGKVWEYATLEYMRSVIRTGDIVHAGASFGDFFPLLSRAAAPGAHIWAFEPNLQNYKAALLTLAVNEIGNITLTHAGLGAEEKTASLVTTNDRGLALGGASFIDADPVHGASAEDIRIIALDNLVPDDRHVDLIQLDIERYEEQALTGALGIIKRSRPVIIVETKPSDEWIREHLRPLNYEFTGRVDENYVYRAEA